QARPRVPHHVVFPSGGACRLFPKAARWFSDALAVLLLRRRGGDRPAALQSPDSAVSRFLARDLVDRPRGRCRDMAGFATRSLERFAWALKARFAFFR